MKKNADSILVTGCAGFIGSNFVRIFKKRFPKRKIVGIDDFSTGRKDAVDPSLVFIEGTLTNENLLKDIMKAHLPQFVFHFAAVPRVSYSVEHPRETTISNIVGTVTLLEAARTYGIKRFIYSSSSSVYGGAKILPTREKDTPANPKNPYAVQKYAGEWYCKVFSDLYGLETICLRYFNVFGPGQYGDSPYATVISAWLESLYGQSAKKPFLEGDGRQSRDFCYIDNVVEANIRAMTSPRTFHGETVNIAQGMRTSLREIKKMIEEISVKKLILEKRPTRIGDIRHTHADISYAKKLLGYQPNKDIGVHIRETIRWFEKREKIKEEHDSK